jgi:hypothetical protein
MSARRTDLSTKSFTIESLDLIAQIRSDDLQLTNTLVDARGASRYEVQVQTKRSGTLNFTIQNTTSGATAADYIPRSNLSVTALTAGGYDFLDHWKSFTLSLTNSTADGSGGRDACTFANYVGGSALELTVDAQVPVAELQYDQVVDMLSATATDRVKAMSVNLGSGQAISGDAVLASVGIGFQRGSIMMVPHTYRWSGLPVITGTVTTGATALISKALTGTASDSLFDLVHDTGAGIITITDARVQSLTVTVNDSDIQTISGVLALAGAPTFTAST